MSIATTILYQLGGQRFITMTGAKNIVSADNGIKFNIGRNASRAGTVRIILNGDDTYTMQFWTKRRSFNPYDILLRFAEKGLSDAEFNKAVTEATEKAVKNAEPRMVKEYDGIYFNQLQSLFTEYTGLYTRL